jgi:hypothetical protein
LVAVGNRLLRKVLVVLAVVVLGTKTTIQLPPVLLTQLLLELRDAGLP